ncbi:hypothetical protein BS78_09G054100 [Paspalum vaginatum]|nr:hypothetical protein BS78_09G054100 [Paspalum vaginatum]
MGHQHPERPSVRILEESKWTGYFIEPTPLPCSDRPEYRMADRRDELVQKVRCMIQEFTRNKENLLPGMKTVDALERLGLSYHFEEDISKFMDVLSSKPVRGDLFAVSLQFRLLRQHHYDVISDVFKNFMGGNGEFKDTLRSNTDGLLSLYEAAHLGKSGEDTLCRAMIFSKDCLSSLANSGQLLQPVLRRVLHALATPTQRRVKRLEAKLYISIYEEDEESNQYILELAKIDFHILQQMHRDEVRSISLWWCKDLNASGMLGPYIRKRPVECYYWALCVFYEPHYAKARKVLAKVLILATIFDDIIDSYSTIEEARQFNQAVQSWDQEAAKKIGDCYWYTIFHISKCLEEFVAEDGASPVGVDCFKETLKEGSKAMLQELVWREERQVPTVHEYLKQAAAVSTLYWPLAVISFAGMYAGDEVFAWARSFPKIIESASTICRLMDDVAGHENEKEERSKCVTAVECYVKEHGVTIQEAKQALSRIIEEHWKIINQELLSDQPMPVMMLDRVLNLARVMEAMYKEVDTYTKCSGVADPIHKLLNECVDH